MSKHFYLRKGEEMPPERIERIKRKYEKSDKIRDKLFPERKGFSIQRDPGGTWLYIPDVVRGCVCHRKPVTMLAVDDRNVLDPDYVPRWVCICRECFIRTDSYRTPEAATNAWNHGIITPMSRALHKPVNLCPEGIANLLNGIGKQAGDELVGYYRTLRKLMQDPHRHEYEIKSVRGHIADLEGFFRESFFFEGLSRSHIIKMLKKRGELDRDPIPPRKPKKKKEVIMDEFEEAEGY